LGPWPFTFC